MRYVLIAAMLSFCACTNEMWAAGSAFGRADAARAKAAKTLKECGETSGCNRAEAQRAFDTADYEREAARDAVGQEAMRERILTSGNVVYVIPVH